MVMRTMVGKEGKEGWRTNLFESSEAFPSGPFRRLNVARWNVAEAIRTHDPNEGPFVVLLEHLQHRVLLHRHLLLVRRRVGVDGACFRQRLDLEVRSTNDGNVSLDSSTSPRGGSKGKGPDLFEVTARNESHGAVSALGLELRFPPSEREQEAGRRWPSASAALARTISAGGTILVRHEARDRSGWMTISKTYWSSSLSST
jgi:hypothetical protein